MTIEKKLQLVEEAFNRVKNNFKVKVILQYVEKLGENVQIRFKFNNGFEQTTSWSFGGYWFDKKEWLDMYPVLPSLANVEKLVPNNLNKSEETMAVLRVAARLYLLFKDTDLIE